MDCASQRSFACFVSNRGCNRLLKSRRAPCRNLFPQILSPKVTPNPFTYARVQVPPWKWVLTGLPQIRSPLKSPNPFTYVCRRRSAREYPLACAPNPFTFPLPKSFHLAGPACCGVRRARAVLRVTPPKSVHHCHPQILSPFGVVCWAPQIRSPKPQIHNPLAPIAFTVSPNPQPAFPNSVHQIHKSMHQMTCKALSGLASRKLNVV
jgi:hypothetical protein